MKTRNRLAWWTVAVLFGLGQIGFNTTFAAEEKHSLWKVEGKDGEGTLYLMGSIHFLKKEFYPLAPVIEKAFEGADTVVFETDIGGMSDPALQVKMMAKGMCAPGKSLKDYLSKETYEKVSKKLGPQMFLMDRLKPTMVALTLMMVELQKLGFSPADGVDHYFHRKAVKAKKTVKHLEEVEFQVGLLFGMTDKEAESFLLQTMDEADSFEPLFKKITDSWKAGDDEALDKVIHESMRKHPSVMKTFLIDRNKDWLPKLKKLRADGKTVFAVVGAGHLVGKDSVVDLLRKSGAKVDQL